MGGVILSKCRSARQEIQGDDVKAVSHTGKYGPEKVTCTAWSGDDCLDFVLHSTCRPHRQTHSGPHLSQYPYGQGRANCVPSFTEGETKREMQTHDPSSTRTMTSLHVMKCPARPQNGCQQNRK